MPGYRPVVIHTQVVISINQHVHGTLLGLNEKHPFKIDPEISGVKELGQTVKGQCVSVCATDTLQSPASHHPVTLTREINE